MINETMKKSIFFIAMVIGSFYTMAQWDGAVGTDGCQAISQNDNSIIAWAKGVEVNRGTWGYGDERIATYGEPYQALGKPDSTTTTAVSLGEGGSAVITFDRPIINGTGKDFVVFENAFSPEFLELAFVEVSSDGVNYFRFPAQTTSYNNEQTPAEGRGAERYNNLAGKYELGFGVGFDLDELEDNALLDKNNIRFVRLIDVMDGISTDSEGNIIYDGLSWASYSQGFDLTGIGVINGGEPYSIADFENSNWITDVNTYEIIDMNSNYDVLEDGVYTKNHISNGMNFQGTGYYMEEYSWFMAMGFGASNITDATIATGNSQNPANFYTSASKYALEGLGKTYLHAYFSSWDFATTEHNIVKAENNQPFYPQGVYVSQSLACYENLLTSTTDDLFLKITAIGYNEEGEQTGTSEVYLFKVENGDTTNHKDWRYLNLADLGQVSKIAFTLECNDYNVSAYFCLDNFVYKTTEVSYNNTIAQNDIKVNIYPNPAKDFVNINVEENSVLQLFDMQGRLLQTTNINAGNTTINTNNLHGTYFVKIISDNKVSTKKLIVK